MAREKKPTVEELLTEIRDSLKRIEAAKPEQPYAPYVPVPTPVYPSYPVYPRWPAPSWPWPYSPYITWTATDSNTSAQLNLTSGVN